MRLDFNSKKKAFRKIKEEEIQIRPVIQPLFCSDLRWEFIKENKKVRKQESDQEKKKVFFFFSCFLDRFLGRILIFFLS